MIYIPNNHLALGLNCSFCDGDVCTVKGSVIRASKEVKEASYLEIAAALMVDENQRPTSQTRWM